MLSNVRFPLRRAFVALVMSAAATTAMAWPDMDPALEAAATEFGATQTAGDAAQIRNAQLFDKLMKEPGRNRDPLALVFAGAATARLANTTIWPWKKLSHAEDGVAMIDKALSLLGPKDEVATTPGTTTSVARTVRYIAASVFVEMPSFFNREAQARKLIDGLSMGIDTDPNSAPAFKASIHTLLGDQAVRAKDKATARKQYERAIAYNTKPEADEARRQLKAISN